MITKEERFREIINDYHIIFDIKFDCICFEDLDHIPIFFIHKTFIHISYNRFWKFYNEEFNMKAYQIQPFLKEMFFKYFKINLPQERFKYVSKDDY